MASYSRVSTVLLIVVLVGSLLMVVTAGDFYEDFDTPWGDDRAQILNNGELLSLSLDQFSGSGTQSRNKYLFAKIDMHLKLVSGNSAGTVTAFYVSYTSIPFFVFYTCKGDNQIMSFSVDGTPIREFKNAESIGVPYPSNQPMRIYTTLWNSDDWATQGGRVKTDWTQAPFNASFTNYTLNACVWSSGSSSCSSISSSSTSSNGAWLSEELDTTSQGRLKWVQENWMIYDYCKDPESFSVDGTPIREFKNAESIGVPYPSNQPMRIYTTLWNSDDWATQGGRVKTDWTQAPFNASFTNYTLNACVWSSGSSSCSSISSSSTSSNGAWLSEELDTTSQGRLKWVQENWMIYDYCKDPERFIHGEPAECSLS
ncbi:unnamed protein product [Ilex paraguariensis]|uniref:Xyloglucan endotransglucosylase/hydrolase n=1 Tax=Ilex paraguariensis TaxID=185542 RepID=A0ABC8UF64_9AQUA